MALLLKMVTLFTQYALGCEVGSVSFHADF
jgi:hypothetical protein